MFFSQLGHVLVCLITYSEGLGLASANKHRMDMDMDPEELELEELAFQQQLIEEEQLLHNLHSSHSPSGECHTDAGSGLLNVQGKRRFCFPNEEEATAKAGNEKRRRKVAADSAPAPAPTPANAAEDKDKAKDLHFVVDDELIGFQGNDDDDNDGGRVSETTNRCNNELKCPRRLVTDIDGDCISITAPSGQRVYSKIEEQSILHTAAHAPAPSQGLLSESIHVLLDRVEREMFEKACHDSKRGMTDEDYVGSSMANENLWVDKYAPKSFTELLSDETTNREVLQWLKQWDRCVFGSTNTMTSSDVLFSLKMHSSHSDTHKYFGNKKFSFKGGSGKGYSSSVGDGGFRKAENWNFERENRNLGPLEKKHPVEDRPNEKIVLLCGPPGLGKTTLAHVAARHCGYDVVEINASDDRTETKMETKILDVVQMNSISSSRPKCLVIDEIDGSLGDGKGGVEVLLKMISSEKKMLSQKQNDDNTQAAGISKKKVVKSGTRLLRPVICICNDISAPALRSLKQVARVYTFGQPSTSRVVSRLKYICNKEGFKASAQGLTALADCAECDIRACLNTLQFLNRRKECLNVVDISSQVVGRKDRTTIIFDIWKEVLRKPRAKGHILQGIMQPSDRFNSLYERLLNHGDFELLGEGIHENFLNMRYHDSAMEKTVKCIDLLCNNDILTRCTLQSQKFYLNVYQPAIMASIHHLIAQIEAPNIEWPKCHQRYRQILTIKKGLVKTWLNFVVPSISKYVSVHSIAQDILSFLLCILSPSLLRPVASQLLTGQEHNEISKLVDIMVNYALTYKKGSPLLLYAGVGQQANVDIEAFVLSPPINELVNFTGYTPKQSNLTSAMQQILSQQVEKQKIIQESMARINRANKVAVVQPSSSSEQLRLQEDNNGLIRETIDDNQVKLSDSISNVLDKHMETSGDRGKAWAQNFSNSKMTQKKTQGGSFIFFNRFTRKQMKTESTQTFSVDTVKSENSEKLLFKFNEGFTNAVKRYVRFGDLM